MRTAVFSIISPARRHHARLLMGSLQRHQPAWDRFVVVVDPGAPANDAEPFTTVALDALALPSPRQFCFRYNVLELNTAVKPWGFAHLFARGYERVVYLDSDIMVYSPLVEIDDAPPDALIILTPHLTGSIEGDDHPSERAMLQAGAYNLGFLAVTRHPALGRFLAWWSAKLEFRCISDLYRGLYMDQKWLDLAPGLFPGVTILRHDGYNVAYWNLRQRSVAQDGDACTVNGQPLRFFHFSGVDDASPDMVSSHDGRLKRADVGAARTLIDGYLAAIRAGGGTFARAAYGFGAFVDGTPIPDAARVAYRDSTPLQIACGDDPFAHPELFRGLRDRRRGPATAALAAKTYWALSRARPLVRLLPEPLRRTLRDFLLGHK
jgi:hypothetical protein